MYVKLSATRATANRRLTRSQCCWLFLTVALHAQSELENKDQSRPMRSILTQLWDAFECWCPEKILIHIHNYVCIICTHWDWDECFTVMSSFSHKRSSDGKLTLNIGLVCIICTCVMQVPTITGNLVAVTQRGCSWTNSTGAAVWESKPIIRLYTLFNLTYSGLIAWPFGGQKRLVRKIGFTLLLPSLSLMECTLPTLWLLLHIRSRMWLPSCSG